MSDWKKDIKQSVVDGALMTTGLVTLAWVGSKAGIAKPSFVPTSENLIKLFIFVSAAEEEFPMRKTRSGYHLCKDTV